MHDNFAVRLQRAFALEDYTALFGDTDQLGLFTPPLDGIRTVLSRHSAAQPLESSYVHPRQPAR